MFDTIFPKLHKEGYRFLIISSVITFILLLISKTLGFLALIITAWVYYFFRDPERLTTNDENYLVSPADGVISQIVNTAAPIEFGLSEKKYKKISIFMNVFNCHVNRMPVSGKISEIFYKPGKFFNASLDKSSNENERNLIKLKTKNSREIILVQIAGLIARRIVCDCKKDDEVKMGERFGMIRFGSRVDLYFETDHFKILAKEKQITIAGESIIAQKI